MLGPLLFGVLLAGCVLLFFMAMRGMMGARNNAVDARLEEYGISIELEAEAQPKGKSRRSWPLVNQFINGFGMGPALARDLERAGMQMTAAEYALICLVLGTVAFVIGAWRGGSLLGLPGPLVGLAAAVPVAYAPVIYLRFQAGGRVKRLGDQLPGVLSLLVGALRAGYGLPQALAVLVEKVPPPASVEFGRVMRAISLGMPVPRAMGQMAERMGSDDLDLLVTAIGVQYELGGNLAQTLDTISETLRERIKIKREITAMTSQQRLTGYIIGALPFFLGLAFYFMNPEYMLRLFQPGMVRVIPVTAVVLEVIGFVVIGKIVNIEV
jgi:tight adherence protein B